MRKKYSIGIDSYRFCIPKSIALKFLKKLELYSKLRKTTRNAQVDMYVKDKFKSQNPSELKYPLNIRYINLKRGVKSLSNTILVLENTKELHELARKHKKKLDYYVMIVFAGLHQPSKDIESYVFSVLAKFLRRFKTYSFDLAMDFESAQEVSYKAKEWLSSKLLKWSNGKIISVGKSLYANHILDSSKYFKLNKILLYDKFHKQRFYHKENIPPELSQWRRLELTFNIKSKFTALIENEGINEAIDVINDIGRAIGACSLVGCNINILSKQVRMLLDLRHKYVFKAWIKG
ncbi:hypothetical protein LS71_002605 [Helicobacter jaachi]|uniref:Uncharacterized protein n=1 Tax=Helicobacter jaachi TaxID=1677920 RepID=A0A4U8TCH5_9HELI|nr:hypothetical protein [Helicobacter jaachi]TLD97649.1 hypothetical protein LS71_002605 [Helicobacter jaachi]